MKRKVDSNLLPGYNSHGYANFQAQGLVKQNKNWNEIVNTGIGWKMKECQCLVIVLFSFK